LSIKATNYLYLSCVKPAKTTQVGGCREDGEGSALFVRDPIRTTEDPEMRRFAAADHGYNPPMYTLLAVLQVIIAGIVIFLVLLHSGKDAGLSGAFGIGGGGSSFGGGSMVERNLDRATIFFAVLFVVNTLVLLKI
jgi:preprotein translocase subunit SecG